MPLDLLPCGSFPARWNIAADRHDSPAPASSTTNLPAAGCTLLRVCRATFLNQFLRGYSNVYPLSRLPPHVQHPQPTPWRVVRTANKASRSTQNPPFRDARRGCPWFYSRRKTLDTAVPLNSESDPHIYNIGYVYTNVSKKRKKTIEADANWFSQVVCRRSIHDPRNWRTHAHRYGEFSYEKINGSPISDYNRQVMNLIHNSPERNSESFCLNVLARCLNVA